MKEKRNFRIVRWGMFAAFLAFGVLTIGNAQTAFIRANKYWGGVDAKGQNSAITYSAADLNTFADMGAVGVRLNGTESNLAGYVTVACRNWRNPSTGDVIPYAVFPPVNSLQPNGKIVTPMANYVRYASPVDSVYYQASKYKLSAPNFGTGATVDPANCIGTSDQTVTVTNEYICGVQVTRKILAWSQQFHDNYVITDLTFTNVSSDTLHEFYILFQDGIYYIARADGSSPSVAAVDQYYNNNTPRRWYHYYGSRTTDTLRIFYVYSSDDPEKSGDNMGQPLTQQQGRLLDKDFWFAATLHASRAPYTPTSSYTGPIDPNDADDMNQPSVATVANCQNVLSLPLFSNSFNVSSQPWYNLLSGQTLASDDMTGSSVRPGHYRVNLDELGKTAPGGEAGISPLANSFESMVYSYGPYEFLPGQQLRIVRAVGIAGISRELAAEVGRKWLSDTKYGTNLLTDPPGLPDPVVGYFPSNFKFPDDATEVDKKKDRWISVGIKELHETVSRAKWNFLNNYNIPTTPPPPPQVVVKPTVGGVTVNWTASPAESDPNFVGYRVWKKVSTYDTVFYKIAYEGTDREFYDTHVRVTAKTFYFVQAGVRVSPTDPNATPAERGDTLWSSRFWTYNSSTAGTNSETLPNLANDLEKIVIVPNPFNYRDPNLPGYNIQTPKNLAVSFYNLPRTVTIRIYTEYGDLVKTIEHNRESGNETWKMVNERGQAIASGIYIVVFQTPEGAVSYQKLVVAR